MANYPATRAHMRKLRSLMATSRSEVDTELSTVDRFSHLPDELAHHVLSFLAITDLTRFGTLSKRCRQLYLSTPSLNFGEFFHTDLSTCDKRLRLLDSLDTFLNLRGDNRIQHFRIDWYPLFETKCFCGDEKSRIIMFINNAIRCKVEVLDVEMSFENTSTSYAFALPSCILVCGSLRSLLMSTSNAFIKTPSVPCWSNLEYLNLTYTDVDEEFFKWISSSCKCIKELSLQNLYRSRNINIQSSSLKSFSIVSGNELCHLKISGEKLEDIHINWWTGLRCSKSLNIFAPNLKYLEWIGNTVDHQLGNLSCLEKAGILLVPKDEFYRKVSFEVLCSIRKVQVLTLYDATTMMGLFEGGFMPAPLADVSCLRIDNIDSFFDKLVPAMVSLFRGMPNLSTLYMKSAPLYFKYHLKADCSGFNMEDWKLQNLGFVSQLKEVTIELNEFSIGSNTIEFSRFILEHAQNLKKMVIVHSSRLPRLYLRNLKKSKMTSNAILLFYETGKIK